MPAAPVDRSRLPYHVRPFMARPEHRPLVIGHRGIPDRAPENTLASFQLALEAGVDAVECDVRLGPDDVLFCTHDRVQTPDSLAVEQLDAAQRAELGFPDFADVLELMDRWPERGLLIEAKTVAGGEKVLDRVAPGDRRMFISFSDHVVRRAMARGWSAAYLNSDSVQMMLDLAPEGAYLGLHHASAAQLDDRYMPVTSTWTINNVPLALSFARRGVWAITTNCADTLLAALERDAAGR